MIKNALRTIFPSICLVTSFDWSRFWLIWLRMLLNFRLKMAWLLSLWHSTKLQDWWESVFPTMVKVLRKKIRVWSLESLVSWSARQQWTLKELALDYLSLRGLSKQMVVSYAYIRMGLIKEHSLRLPWRWKFSSQFNKFLRSLSLYNNLRKIEHNNFGRNKRPCKHHHYKSIAHTPNTYLV